MQPRAKKILKKTLFAAAGTIAVLLATVAVLTAVRVNRKIDAPYPDVHASRDPAVIERGRYLVRGAAHCADCHGAPEQRAALEGGQDVPLTGGFEFHLPVGTFRVPNITPDPETGRAAIATARSRASCATAFTPTGGWCCRSCRSRICRTTI
jgi:mono/diheme cytochrome c family protein